jgi:hypothetical protein
MPDDPTQPFDHPAGVALTIGDRVNIAVRRAAEIKRRREAMAAEDKALATELDGLVRRAIPELLAEVGTTVWKVEDAEVEIKGRVGGTFAKAPNEVEGVKYLRDNDFPGPIKTVLMVEFSEEERTICDAVARSIVGATGKNAEYARNINPQTLAKWGRDRLSEGLPLDFAKVGLTFWREAVLSKY